MAYGALCWRVTRRDRVPSLGLIHDEGISRYFQSGDHYSYLNARRDILERRNLLECNHDSVDVWHVTVFEEGAT